MIVCKLQTAYLSMLLYHLVTNENSQTGFIFTLVVRRIEIDIDFTKRPPEGDSTAIIDRLERIEKETSERLSRDAETCDASSSMTDLPTYTRCSMTFMSDFDSWKADNFSSMIDTNNEVEDVLSDINFNIPNIDSGQ